MIHDHDDDDDDDDDDDVLKFRVKERDFGTWFRVKEGDFGTWSGYYVSHQERKGDQNKSLPAIGYPDT